MTTTQCIGVFSIRGHPITGWSLHLLFRTPFIVEARRLLKEIVDSA